jgi:predicted ester cyclase
MNTTKNVITEVFTDIEQGKFEQASAILSDNFKSNILGKEVNKLVYISSYRSLMKGFPDLKFDLQNIKTDGSKVTAKLKISGTNSHSIPALLKGWHEIPATNKKIDGLVTDIEVTLQGDKVEEIRNAGSDTGLFIRLLEKLGLDYKKLQEN